MTDCSIYKNRRKQLLKHMKPNSIAIIEASSEKIRNNDSAYRYRQCSDFYYLTGYNRPDAVLLIHKNKNMSISQFYSKRPNKHDSVWTGDLWTSKKIARAYGFNKANYLDNFEKDLADKLAISQTIYHSLTKFSVASKAMEKCMNNLEKDYRKGKELPTSQYSLSKITHNMRLIKSKDEISIIKDACSISAKAHINLMKSCKPKISEKQIEAQLIYDFGSNGAVEAYNSIVASGKNSCILHYTENSSILKGGDLLLTDAACEYQNYASDITRTIPINGKFSPPQKTLYELVLLAQEKAIAKCIVGNTLKDVHQTAVKTLSKGLIKIGLLKDNLKLVIKNELYKKFYMHNTGHWMGLDVHDPSDYMINGKPITLKPGMIFTVEPGLYIKADKSVDKIFHNIGIRIEDDILITKNGPEVLTSEAPKSIRDIENLMKFKNE